MLEVLKLLKDTPLPSVLVIGGIVLIAISFLRKVSTSLEPDPTSTGQARLFGLFLLVVGIGLYLIPSPQPTSSPQQPVSPAGRTPATESTMPTGNGKYPCSLLVSKREVDAWRVGQTTVSAVNTAITQFAAKRPNDAGAFAIGGSIPSGVLVATNFDEQDGTAWTQYPVAPVIHSGSWGLFETTGEYAAPKPGACMTIVP